MRTLTTSARGRRFYRFTLFAAKRARCHSATRAKVACERAAKACGRSTFASLHLHDLRGSQALQCSLLAIAERRATFALRSPRIFAAVIVKELA